MFYFFIYFFTAVVSSPFPFDGFLLAKGQEGICCCGSDQGFPPSRQRKYTPSMDFRCGSCATKKEEEKDLWTPYTRSTRNNPGKRKKKAVLISFVAAAVEWWNPCLSQMGNWKVNNAREIFVSPAMRLPRIWHGWNIFPQEEISSVKRQRCRRYRCGMCVI